MEKTSDINTPLNHHKTTSLSPWQSLVVLINGRRARIWSIVVLFFSTMLLSVTLELSTTTIYIFSGSIGVISGGYVLGRYISDRTLHTPVMTLLFYRTVCDVGLGLRFLFAGVLRLESCEHGSCEEGSGFDHNNCALAGAILEFFEISSEMWFCCAAVDLAITLTNPFSPFKKRVAVYHGLSWGLGLLMALLVGCIDAVNGQWYLDSQLDDAGICWVSSGSVNGSRLNYRSWIFLYLPILVIYSYAGYVMFCARVVLGKGIRLTFLHRARVLYMSQVAVGVSSAYYVILFLLMFLTTAAEAAFGMAGQHMWLAFLFLVCAKGFACLIVFFIVQTSAVFSSSSTVDSVQSSTLYDINHALQQEVVTYATVGIQKCSSMNSYSTDSLDKHVLCITVPQDMFKLPLEKFFQLAKGPIQDLTKALRRSALAENMSILKSVLQTRDETFSLCSQSGVSSRPSSASFVSPLASDFKLDVKPAAIDIETDRFSESNPTGSSGYVPYSSNSLSIFAGPVVEFWSWMRSQLLVLERTREIEFVEYAPSVFRKIRELYGIEGIYARSFEKQIVNRVTEGGASNALFFYSQCGRFMAKSCNAEEMQHIRTHAYRLMGYLANNKESFITKIYGAYKLKMYACDLYFIVTNNVLQTKNGELISEKYDLKGSSVYRNMKPPKNGERVRCKACGTMFTYNSKSHVLKDKRGSWTDSMNDGVTSPKRSSANRGFSDTDIEDVIEHVPICPLFRHEPDCILKDNDLRGRTRFRLPRNEGAKVMEQLHADAHFLSDTYKVMDYSLLVGVFKKVIDVVDREDASVSNTDSTHAGDCRLQAGEFVVDYSYYVGIIDYQQEYLFRKRVENWVKVNLLCQHKDELSCVSPEKYRDRFLDFMEDLFL